MHIWPTEVRLAIPIKERPWSNAACMAKTTGIMKPSQQSARWMLPLVPEAAHVEDRFLLDLTLPEEWLHAHAGWLTQRDVWPTRSSASVVVNRLQTISAYDRLSTALTVAQVYGVQRLCNHYAARLAPLPGPDSSRESNRRLAQMTQYARQLLVRLRSLTPFPAASWMRSG